MGSPPPPLTELARGVDDLFGVAGALVFGAMVLVLFGFAVALVVGRLSAGGRAATVDWRVPLVATVVLVLLVEGPLLWLSIRDQAKLEDGQRVAESAADGVLVQVNGRQWAWEFRLAGPDRIFATADDVVTTDELVVPVDAPIALQLGAIDVVHSFFVPELRMKRDAIPGRLTRLWFRAERKGTFEVVCAELCGTGHFRMRATLRVVSRDDFQAWMTWWSDNAARTSLPGANWGWAWEPLP